MWTPEVDSTPAIDPTAAGRLALGGGLTIEPAAQFIDWGNFQSQNGVWQVDGRVNIDGGTVWGMESGNHVLALTMNDDGLMQTGGNPNDIAAIYAQLY